MDGHVAARFPGTRGKKVRTQIDSPGGCPPRLQELVDRFRRASTQTREYRDAILGSKFIGGVRVVTGLELGRFG